MLQWRLGSPNGTDVYEYEAGKEYDETTFPPLSRELAESFVDKHDGAAEWVKDDTGTRPVPVEESEETQQDFTTTDNGAKRRARSSR